MATGTYGNRRPSDVSIDDIEMYYTYTPNRETLSTDVFSLTVSDVLTEITNPTISGTPLGGLYNMTLPSTIFNEVGIYTIFIRPRQIQTVIEDCGVLSALPDVKGIVLDTNRTELQEISERLNNNGLVGYRVEYFNEDNTKRRNFYRVVTSSNRAEPITENVSNTTQTSVRYRFNDAGSLLFLTLTPSSATNVKPNATPFIGEPNQNIYLINTYFNPITIEVELTEYSMETLSIGIFGEQTRAIEEGLITYYDDDRNIFAQYDLYEILDENDTPIFEVKQKRVNIDETKDFESIIDQA
jgi:hypothetical protein